MTAEMGKGASREGDPPGSTRCRICGYLLTAEKSVKRGIGPDCWAKIQRGEIEGFYDIEKETEDKRGTT